MLLLQHFSIVCQLKCCCCCCCVVQQKRQGGLGQPSSLGGSSSSDRWSVRSLCSSSSYWCWCWCWCNQLVLVKWYLSLLDVTLHLYHYICSLCVREHVEAPSSPLILCISAQTHTHPNWSCPGGNWIEELCHLLQANQAAAPLAPGKAILQASRPEESKARTLLALCSLPSLYSTLGADD